VGNEYDLINDYEHIPVGNDMLMAEEEGNTSKVGNEYDHINEFEKLNTIL